MKTKITIRRKTLRANMSKALSSFIRCKFAMGFMNLLKYQQGLEVPGVDNKISSFRELMVG